MLDILYIISLLYVLFQDFNNKYIYTWSFYIMNILGVIYYYAIFSNLIITLLLFIMIVGLFSLEIYTKYKGEIKILGKDWILLGTGIYDYYLYIFLTFLIGNHLINNFGNIELTLSILIILIMSIIFGIILHLLHNRSIKLFLTQYDNNNINYKTTQIESFIEKKKINIFEIINLYKKDIILKNNINIIEYYNKMKTRVPAFIYGNLFIIIYILYK